MERNPGRLFRLCVAAIVLLLAAGALAGSGFTTSLASAPLRSGAMWQDVAESTVAHTGNRDIVPSAYRVVKVDEAALLSLLSQAPLETNATRAGNSAAIISLPLPDGTTGRFSFVNSPVMEPRLAAKFPEIQTYAGQGIDEKTATVRFDHTRFGFHAMILSANGTIFIDPYQRGDTTTYISYEKVNYVPTANDRMVELGVEDSMGPKDPSSAVLAPATGPQLRTYRLALAATGEYTIFYGGTVGGALSGMTTSVNRVTGVYEREVAVRLVLVANTNLLIYTNPNTDPYTNNDGGAMLSQNQSNIDAVIGTANYDIGHVFSTGGGGIAGLGVVCATGQKALGVTGSGSPSGDPFDIDYVSHEIGHQFAGNHSFNGTTGSCGGGNRNGPTAWEPGSGSTIMAYAGICGAEDLQPHSDEFFHIGNIDEIVNFTTTGGGNSCAAVSSTGNQAPTVNGGADYTIPISTSFKLTATGSDPDGGSLTYYWEQQNAGEAAPPNTDNGNRAIFRSFVATTQPYRYFPKLADILGNTIHLGEAYPTTNRTMLFRVSARDNQAGGGGLTADNVSITSTTSSGPFVITSQNSATSWIGGTSEDVTWDVANTTTAPVSCANVDITLSTDGGLTFPTSLIAGTANDGSQSITVPNVTTSEGRIQVMCSNNVFLDINNANIAIEAGTATPVSTPTTEPTPTVCPIEFTDVPVGSTFYPYITCMACQGIINGYEEGCETGNPCFRPANNVTRGQLSKIVSNAAGFSDVPGAQQFEDIVPGSTFYEFVWRLAERDIVGGYPCGGPGEPCGFDTLPYFRPNNNVTRGQLAKIVAKAAGFLNVPGAQQFEDVPPDSTFFGWIWNLADRGIMSGYACGGPGEPCIAPDDLPYFRPGSTASRGQASKVVSNTFFPSCAPER